MKFTCHKKIIQDAIQRIVDITGREIDEERFFTLYVRKNTIQLIAKSEKSTTKGNAEVLIFNIIDVDVQKEGEIKLHAATLSDIISKIPYDQFSLELIDNKKIFFKADTYEAALSVSPDDLAIEDTPSDGIDVNIRAEDFRKVLYRTCFAAEESFTGYRAVVGVSIRCRSNVMEVIATDMRLYAKAVTNLEQPISVDCFNVLPKKAIQEILQLLKIIPSNEIVTLKFSASKCIVRTESITYISGVYATKYPYLEDSSIKKYLEASSVDIDREDLQRKVDVALILAEAGNVSLRCEGSKLHIKAHRTLLDDFSEDYLRVPKSTAVFEAKINGRNIFDVLKHLSPNNKIRLYQPYKGVLVINLPGKLDCFYALTLMVSG